MTQAHLLQTNFSSGELDPLMVMRVDTGAYQNGAAKLTNCQLLNTGGADRRNGMLHRAVLPARARLLPFEFSATERYVLALSAGRLDVYSTAGALLTSVTTGCNWTLASLFELTFAQVADVMIVAHTSWQTQVIRRTGASSFTVTNLAFDQAIGGDKIYQPYFKFAADDVTIRASGTTGSVTLTASAAAFSSDMVGQRLRWHDTEIEITAYTNSTTMTGTIKGKLEVRVDPNPFRTTNGSGVVEVTHVAHGFATGQSITLSGANAVSGITAVQLTGTFTITVVDDNRYTISTAGTATDSADGGGPNVRVVSSNTYSRNWSEPVFCDRNGWPGAVCFHEGRLWFGGTSGIPDGLWSSAIFRYFNFEVGEGLDNESIQVTIGSDDISSVRHLVSHRGELMIFTALGEFYAPAPPSSSLTPASMRVKRQTPYGCSAVAPQPFDGATLYVQASGNAVREFIFSNTEDGYTSTNLNILSGHLINAPRDMAVLFGSSVRSEQYAFVVNGDGTAAVFNSARAENLAGWTPWVPGGDGLFDAVCVVGSEVYFSVLRGGTYRLEQLSADRGDTLDGLVQYTAGSPTNSWTVGSVFYSKTVHVVSGNYYLGEFEVGSAGQLVLTSAVSEIRVGYEFDWLIRLLPINLQLPAGPALHLPKRINRVQLSINAALAVSIAGSRLLLRQVDEDFSVAPEPVTGTYEFFVLGYQRDATVEVTQLEPLACTVLGMMMEVTF